MKQDCHDGTGDDDVCAGIRRGRMQALRVVRHLMKHKDDKDIINRELKKLEATNNGKQKEI